MKIYVVVGHDIDRTDPLGVFSTREVAQTFADTEYAWVYEREVYDTIPERITIYYSECRGAITREFSYPLWPWEKDSAERPVEAVMPAVRSPQWDSRYVLRVSGTDEAEVRAKFRELLVERQP